MKVRTIYAPETKYDNYMYLIIDEDSKQCAAVDPVSPDRICAALKEEGITLTTILTTHYHWDHAGGNQKLVDRLGIKVVVGEERSEAVTLVPTHNQKIKIGSTTITCLHTPCHTVGHVCYLATAPGATPAVFTGDTLFIAGCGHFFEGTPADMYKNFTEILAKLPMNTEVYVGHEYTVNNLKFGLSVEPKNTDMQEKLEKSKEQISKNQFTVPSTIEGELKYNPFMRVREPVIQQYLGVSDPVTAMGRLRETKNKFKAS